jgi:hypothetical protein
MDEAAALVARLEKIEALFAKSATPGERIAADEARRRIRERIARLGAKEPVVELRFAIHDSWSRRLFTALLRRYDIRPYRYPRQRRQTLMARMPRSAVDDLWREFTELDKALHAHLNAVAMTVITRAISPDTSEAAEVAEGAFGHSSGNSQADEGK